MSLSADALYKMSDVELLAAYVEARRQFVEKKFTRDTHRARLEWIKAKMFMSSSGGVTERNMAIEVSEEIARKGQELREMTRDLDLLKVDPKNIENNPMQRCRRPAWMLRKRVDTPGKSPAFFHHPIIFKRSSARHSGRVRRDCSR
jgi:hypothetical protein